MEESGRVFLSRFTFGLVVCAVLCVITVSFLHLMHVREKCVYVCVGAVCVDLIKYIYKEGRRERRKSACANREREKQNEGG